MGDEKPIYNLIGETYSRTRKADPRIVELLVGELGLDQNNGEELLELGCGTANYSVALAERGFKLSSLDASNVMLEQARAKVAEHKLESKVRLSQGRAQGLAFPDEQFFSTFGVLVLHHLEDLDRCLAEACRVTRAGGRVAFFTADPRKKGTIWVEDYFGFLVGEACKVYIPIEELGEKLAPLSIGDVKITAFELPRDLQDLFFLSGWARPALYLDPLVRKGISHFAKAMHQPELNAQVESAIKGLEADLESGEWQAKYGASIAGESFDGGYRLVSFTRK
jgi:SAM-dependent methyltransferase